MSMFNDLKIIAEVLQKANKIDEYKQILEVQEKLLKLQDENAELKSKVKNLQKKLKLTKNVEYKNNAYWIIQDKAHKGPFCTRCYDKDKTLIRLQPLQIGQFSFYCPECKNNFQKVSYE